MALNKRAFLRLLGITAAMIPLRGLSMDLSSVNDSISASFNASVSSPATNTDVLDDFRDIYDVDGNFHFIYDSDEYKAEFYKFLTNVFHLFPEQALHELISLSANQHSSDAEIYRAIQSQLDQIKPMLADLTYAIPALAKQKHTMASQTKTLLADTKRIDGYLELGSNGRYLDALEDHFQFEGEQFFISERAPSYSIADMISRGSIVKQGQYIALNNYQPDMASTISANSLDLISVFIGFHHSPLHLRKEFISNLRDKLKPGGKLLLRDHDAANEKMVRMVALAHDVFNAGTYESLEYNKQELRNFYSLEYLDQLLVELGFKSRGKPLYQAGDPTMNALMLYERV